MTTMSPPNAVPVPRLTLEAILPGKDVGTPRGPLTAGSDRSCATPVAKSTPPFPVPPLVVMATTVDDAATPQSVGLATPRGTGTGTLTLAPLTLSSPCGGGGQRESATTANAAALRTPRSSPLLSPRSPRSPSMMSPMRMVGLRSPCSVKLSGSTRLSSDGTIKPGRHQNCQVVVEDAAGAVGAGAAGTDGSDTMMMMMMKHKKPSVSRALPFTQPTTAAVDQDFRGSERFQVPHLNGRELSFSDLLDPQAKHPNTAINTANQVLNSNSPLLQVLVHPTQSRPASAHKMTAAAYLMAAPLPVAPTSTTTTTITTTTTTTTSSLDDQLTPRKRPRKNSAPQRADFGGDDSDNNNINNCGGGGGSGDDCNNNIAMMMWEDADGGQSMASKQQHEHHQQNNRHRAF